MQRNRRRRVAEKEARPEFVKQEHLEYLDELRESAVTNMFGAARYLVQRFGLSIGEARNILSYWMTSFGDPNR